ncbi:hypothetical protein HAX54_040230, partial [Datura stramonium]|nr:hypothetical protein [Datura stramonium]
MMRLGKVLTMSKTRKGSTTPISMETTTLNKITGKNNSSPAKSIGEEREDADQNDNENQKKMQEGLDINNKKKCDKKQQQKTDNFDPNPPNNKEGDFVQISEEDVSSTIRGRSRIIRHGKSKRNKNISPSKGDVHEEVNDWETKLLILEDIDLNNNTAEGRDDLNKG